MHVDGASSSAAPAPAEHTSSVRTLASVEDAVKGTLLWAKAGDEWPWWPAEVVGRGRVFELGPSVKVKFYETNAIYEVYMDMLAPWEESENIMVLEETRIGECACDGIKENGWEVAQGAQGLGGEGAGGSAAPPGWKKTMNFGKRTGYRGPDGQRVTSRPAAWRREHERTTAAPPSPSSAQAAPSRSRRPRQISPGTRRRQRAAAAAAARRRLGAGGGGELPSRSGELGRGAPHWHRRRRRAHCAQRDDERRRGGARRYRRRRRDAAAARSRAGERSRAFSRSPTTRSRHSRTSRRGSRASSTTCPCTRTRRCSSRRSRTSAASHSSRAL